MDTSFRSPFRQELWLVCAVLAIVSTAQGDLVSVQVTGQVTYSDFGTIGVGTAVTGLYTYDDMLVPDTPNPFNGWYRPITATLGFADGSRVSSNAAELLINNNSSGIGTVDEYVLYVTVTPGSGTATGAFAEGDPMLVAGGILRHDPTGTAWDGIALPDPETVLALLPMDSSVVYWHDVHGVSKFMDFTVTDLSVVPVPIPGAVLLGAIGLGCSSWLVRRRWQKTEGTRVGA